MATERDKTAKEVDAISIEISSDGSEDVEHVPANKKLKSPIHDGSGGNDSDNFSHYVSLTKVSYQALVSQLPESAGRKRAAKLQREGRRLKQIRGKEAQRRRKRISLSSGTTSELRDAVADVSNISDDEPNATDVNESASSSRKRLRTEQSVQKLDVSKLNIESPQVKDIEENSEVAVQLDNEKTRNDRMEIGNEQEFEDVDHSESKQENDSVNGQNVADSDDLLIVKENDLPDTQKFLRQRKVFQTSPYVQLNYNNAKSKQFIQNAPRLPSRRSDRLSSNYILLDSDSDNEVSDSSRMSTDVLVSVSVS